MIFKENKLEKMVKKQEKALGIFTEIRNTLTGLNEELKDLLKELTEQEAKIQEDKKITDDMIANNLSVLSYLPKLQNQ